MHKSKFLLNYISTEHDAKKNAVIVIVIYTQYSLCGIADYFIILVKKQNHARTIFLSNSTMNDICCYLINTLIIINISMFKNFFDFFDFLIVRSLRAHKRFIIQYIGTKS